MGNNIILLGRLNSVTDSDTAHSMHLQRFKPSDVYLIYLPNIRYIRRTEGDLQIEAQTRVCTSHILFVVIVEELTHKNR